MSLSWPKLSKGLKRWFPGRARRRYRLRIGLAPHRILLADHGGRRQADSERAESIAIEPRPGAARWQAAVDALPAALAGSAAANARVTVILSNQLARYALLPWNAALKNDDEWSAYARHRLQAIHGGAADEWDLRVCETAPNGPRLACALDRALIPALESAVAESGAALESVQPYLMTAFNRARLAAGENCWLVVEEPGRLMLALIQDGAWRSVRAHRAGAGWRRDLGEILEREAAALGMETVCTDIAIQAEAPLDEKTPPGYRIRELTPAYGAPRALTMVAQ